MPYVQKHTVTPLSGLSLHTDFMFSKATPVNLFWNFFDLIYTNDMEKLYEMPLGQKFWEQILEVRSDKGLEVSYMTYAQKMMDERRIGYIEDRGEDRSEGLKDAIMALKGIVDSAVTAERFKILLD